MYSSPPADHLTDDREKTLNAGGYGYTHCGWQCSGTVLLYSVV
jgi:hypothetical protein